MDESILTNQETSQMVGENRTEYVVDSYVALNEVTSKPAICILFGGMILTILSGLIILFFGKEENLILAITMLAMGLIFFPLMYFIIKRSLKKAVETNVKINKNAVLHFQFFNEKVHVYAKSDTQDGASDFEYSTLSKVIETNGYLFLFIQPTVALCVNKNAFLSGKDEVIEVLKSKVRKFKTMQKNK